MAHFFTYDNGFYKHQIFGIETKNEKGKIVGYRPMVQRVNAKEGGVVEQISDKYPQVKWKIFSTENLAREFAIQFFMELPKDDRHIEPPNSVYVR